MANNAPTVTIAIPGIEAILDRLEALEAKLDQAGATSSQSLEPLCVGREGAAQMLDSSLSSVDQWRKDGLLKAVYLDTKPRFAVDDLRKFVESRKA